MEKLLLTISVFIPFFSFLSTLLMVYADKHTVSVDPLSVIERAAAELNDSHYKPHKAKLDIKKELHNRKMKRIINILVETKVVPQITTVMMAIIWYSMFLCLSIFI